ncbi:MFS transporter [Catenulispora rubra]|uniref:MFS transporter n=1 Tax=Catenulispora rubra TaxID=280293 RepID=UPI001892303B|nr:MFS transporter [Catenulispora rubra]
MNQPEGSLATRLGLRVLRLFGLPDVPPDIRPLILATAVQGLATSGFSAYVTIWAIQRLHAAAGAVGVALFIRAASGIGSGYLGGRLSDRRGRRPVILASWLAQAVCIAAFTFAGGHVLPGLALIVAFGPLGPPGSAASSALIADAVPAGERKSAFASMRVLRSMSVILGPPGAALLVAVGGWPTMFAGLATVSLAAVVTARLLIHDPPRRDSAAAGKETADRTLWRDGTFLLFLSSITLITLTLAATDRFLPVAAVSSYHLPVSAWGALIALNPVLIVLFQARATRFGDRLPRQALVIVAATLTGGPFLLFLLNTSAAMIAAVVVLSTFGEIAWTPTAQALAADLAPAPQRGAYLGAFDGSVSLAYAVGPLAALEIHATASDAVVWWSGAGVAAVGAVLAVAALQQTSDPRSAGDPVAATVEA